MTNTQRKMSTSQAGSGAGGPAIRASPLAQERPCPDGHRPIPGQRRPAAGRNGTRDRARRWRPAFRPGIDSRAVGRGRSRRRAGPWAGRVRQFGLRRAVRPAACADGAPCGPDEPPRSRPGLWPGPGDLPRGPERRSPPGDRLAGPACSWFSHRPGRILAGRKPGAQAGRGGRGFSGRGAGLRARRQSADRSLGLRGGDAAAGKPAL